MVGYDTGKRVKGRKRHLVTDTLGLMLRIEVHSAIVQDRAAAALVLDRITRRFPFLERIFADAGYQGPRVAAAATRPVEIIKRTDTGFVVQPKRWVIERALLSEACCRSWRGSINEPNSRLLASGRVVAAWFPDGSRWLSGQATGSGSLWDCPWRLLSRLLLRPDDPPLRRRHHEFALDRRPDDTILVEKIIPAGRLIPRASGAVIIASGLWMLLGSAV